MKWLQKLTVSAREHDGFWVASGYRYPVRRVLPGATVDARDQAPLAGLAVKSLITRPLEGTVVTPGPVAIAGFAWAGESRIARVEVSIDAGASWTPATLVGPVHKYAWRRFEHRVTLREGVHTILSRATDEHGASPTDRTGVESVRLSLERSRPHRRDRRHIRHGGEASPRAGAGRPPASHPGSRTFDTACRACHDDNLSAQQRLSP